MLQFIGKFVGPEEILEVRETGNVTHRGVPIIEVVTRRQETEDQTRVTTNTTKGLELIATEERCTWDVVQNTKLGQVVREFMNIATDLGVQGGELQPLLAKLGLALAVRFEHAAHIKFEGDDREFVPGGSEFYSWSLAKAEHIITSNGKTE